MTDKISDATQAGNAPDCVHMGWAAPPIKDQFPQLPDAISNRLQMDSDSITHLSMRGIMTTAEKKKAMFRFMGLVSDALKWDRRAAIAKATGDAQ